MANKIERKYRAHFIDASFGTGSATPNYVRLGADLEEYNLDLNIFKGILETHTRSMTDLTKAVEKISDKIEELTKSTNESIRPF